MINVAFSPDGALLLTGSYDGTARLWESVTHTMVGAPIEHRGEGVAFSPDGKWLLIGSRLRDVATLKPVGPPYGDWAESTAFSADGSRILTATSPNTVRLWDFAMVPVQGEVGRIKLWVEVITGLSLGPEGGVRVLDAQSWHERRGQLDALGGPPI